MRSGWNFLPRTCSKLHLTCQRYKIAASRSKHQESESYAYCITIAISLRVRFSSKPLERQNCDKNRIKTRPLYGPLNTIFVKREKVLLLYFDSCIFLLSSSFFFSFLLQTIWGYFKKGFYPEQSFALQELFHKDIFCITTKAFILNIPLTCKHH